MVEKFRANISDRYTLLVRVLVILILGVIVLLGGLTAFGVSRQLSMTNSGSVFPALPMIPIGPDKPQSNQQIPSPPGTDTEHSPTRPASETPTLEAEPVSDPTLAAWDGAGRVTILLLGLDHRDWQANEVASRSDTMILLTLDPLTKSAGMLSIPRDMWVSIPGFQHGKINTAYYLGDAHKLPGGGPGLAVKTVESFLGIPIHYYAQIDFAAFVRFIDEIGGVKIDVPEAITIDLLGSGHQTKKTLQPGVQVLPGEWALAYARARYTEGGDFDRAKRQQQVVMGIRDRILSFDMLPTLIAKAPALYSELVSSIRTNLNLDDVIKLAVLGQSIPDENIQSDIIGKEEVYFGFSPDGLSILIPIPDDIHLLRDQIFASSNGLGPETPGDARQKMVAEGASIILFDGTQSPELLNRSARYLSNQGANIAHTAEADLTYTSTTVIDYTGNPYTIQYLVELMGISPYKIYLKYDPTSQVDVEVYLGSDWARQRIHYPEIL